MVTLNTYFNIFINRLEELVNQEFFILTRPVTELRNNLNNKKTFKYVEFYVFFLVNFNKKIYRMQVIGNYELGYELLSGYSI